MIEYLFLCMDASSHSVIGCMQAQSEFLFLLSLQMCLGPPHRWDHVEIPYLCWKSRGIFWFHRQCQVTLGPQRFPSHKYQQFSSLPILPATLVWNICSKLGCQLSCLPCLLSKYFCSNLLAWQIYPWSIVCHCCYEW